MDCCDYTDKLKKQSCIRKKDGKKFKLPRRFTKKRCLQGIKGFTMRSSCAPFINCKKKRKTIPF